MSMFGWRSPLVEPRVDARAKGAIRAQVDNGLAPSPTAPFGDMRDAQGRPALPSGGAQDEFVLRINLERLRARDPGFDPDALARLAADAMVTVERAWSTLDPQPSRAVMSPALWASHRARMGLYSLHGRRNVVDSVQVHSAKVVSIDEDGGRDRVTVRIRASSTDYDVDSAGTVLRGDTEVHTWEADWTVERASSAASRGDGGLLGGHCPACGAPLQLDADGLCAYCHAAATDASRDWVVAQVADVGREDDVMRAVLGIRTRPRTGPDDLSPTDEVVSTNLPLPPASAAGSGTDGDDPLRALRLADPNVDAVEITAAARTAFVAVQTAWRGMDPAPARPVMTADGVAALARAIAALQQAGLHRASDDPLIESAAVVTAAPGDEWQSATVRLVATTVDADVDASGAAVRGSLLPRPLGCDLPLRRRVRGLGDVSRCPRCGAPLRASVTGVCDFCREAVAGGGGDWLLDSVPVLTETRAPAATAPAADPAPTTAGAATPLDALRARDPHVNAAELLARAREVFFAIEGALARRRLDAAGACTSATFLAALQNHAAALGAAHQHRVLAFIDLDGAQLVDAGGDHLGDRVVVQLDVTGEDCVVDDANGAAVAGSTAQRRWCERWTLVRAQPGDPWVVDAVEAG